MAYKTLMLKIYKPSATKRRILDGAIYHYTLALQFLLDRYRTELVALAAGTRPVGRMALLSLLDKDVLQQLNAFQVEPFKDSIKMEFAAIASAYISQFRKNPKTQYPYILLTDEGYAELVDGLIRKFDGGAVSRKAFENEFSKIVSHTGRLHPLYFGRYSKKRDYCLLYDDTTRRFYAKLYLLNAANKMPAPRDAGRLQLHYVTKDKEEALPALNTVRYIVVPLAFGKYQWKDLQRLLHNPGMVHTARLKKIKKDYYLYINISCEPAVTVKTETIMGIARNASGGLHYTVCDENGRVLSADSLEKEGTDCQKLYLLAKRIMAVCRRFKPQVVLEAAGGKNDKIYSGGRQEDRPMKTTEYMRFSKILRVKLQETGLPEPIEVSANSLYLTCPDCACISHKSLISPELFACVECGYASRADSVGSYNLIKKLDRYKKDKVPIYQSCRDGKLYLENEIIGFACSLPQGCTDLSQMYYELELLTHCHFQFDSNTKKYAMLKKLREAPNICDAVKVVSSRNKQRMH